MHALNTFLISSSEWISSDARVYVYALLILTRLYIQAFLSSIHACSHRCHSPMSKTLYDVVVYLLIIFGTLWTWLHADANTLVSRIRVATTWPSTQDAAIGVMNKAIRLKEKRHVQFCHTLLFFFSSLRYWTGSFAGRLKPNENLWVHYRLHIYPLCGIFYFPWHRHYIERTTGF